MSNLLTGILLKPGLNGPRVTLDGFFSDTTPAGIRSWGIEFGNDGDFTRGEDSSSNTNPGPYTIIGDTWLLRGAASDYDIRCVETVTPANATLGTDPPGSLAFNTWYNLGSDRAWWYSNNSAFAQNWSMYFEIRDASTLEVLATSATRSYNTPSP